jgi:beta-phosphoglucomutase-like phosphatase (HAD superfamily)
VAHDLVIFDCDGVLIDSELLAVRADLACLAEEGIEESEETILDRYVGVSMSMMKADLENRFGRKLREDFDARHAARLRALFETDLLPLAGVGAVLDRLAGEGLAGDGLAGGLAGKICVASSSAPERLRHALSLAGLYERFHPHVFSATMVARGKPAPDLFLHAAARMAAEPARCVVVEDSVPGVQAAVAAGMTAIGFTGGGHCRPGHGERLRSHGAAVVVDSMAALLPSLAVLPQLR